MQLTDLDPHAPRWEALLPLGWTMPSGAPAPVVIEAVFSIRSPHTGRVQELARLSLRDHGGELHTTMARLYPAAGAR
jgi:hypothetical protein